MLLNSIKEFLRLEAAGGILLIIATILAMAVVNSPLQSWYELFLNTPVEVRVGALQIAKPLLLWINDGLMALFFLLVGLELKREIVLGELSNPAQVALPIIAAVGGMLVPALIYTAFNWGDAVAMRGWAIPTATDIAFALGVLSLLGKRVPQALKLFLLTLAIADDLGAIVIIALFYSGDLSMFSFSVAWIAMIGLFILNRWGVMKLTPYLVLGLILWTAVLKSGVHATLAGVALALFIPVKLKDEHGHSPLEKLEHDLHSSVAYGILPLFAFANTGISFAGMALVSVLESVPLGITAGLFIGKQVGVMLFSWLAVALKLGRLPAGVTWGGMYGVSLLCGIGFTMSLFISSLAFDQTVAGVADDRLGIIGGSLISAIAGYLILRWQLAARREKGAVKLKPSG
jgi:NhaA family Na+:H+ antiporter